MPAGSKKKKKTVYKRGKGSYTAPRAAPRASPRQLPKPLPPSFTPLKEFEDDDDDFEDDPQGYGRPFAGYMLVGVAMFVAVFVSLALNTESGNSGNSEPERELDMEHYQNEIEQNQAPRRSYRSGFGINNRVPLGRARGLGTCGRRTKSLLNIRAKTTHSGKELLLDATKKTLAPIRPRMGPNFQTPRLERLRVGGIRLGHYKRKAVGITKSRRSLARKKRPQIRHVQSKRSERKRGRMMIGKNVDIQASPWSVLVGAQDKYSTGIIVDENWILLNAYFLDGQKM